MFLPVARDQLIDGLVQGKGDIAAGGLSIIPSRAKKVDFSEPTYSGVSEIVVTSKGAKLSSVEDLSGKEVHVRRESSYFESLQTLNKQLVAKGKKEVKLVPVDEVLEADDILELLNAGLIPATVVDAHLARLWSKAFKRGFLKGQFR